METHGRLGGWFFVPERGAAWFRTSAGACRAGGHRFQLSYECRHSTCTGVSYFGLAAGYRFTGAGGNFQVANVPCVQYSLSVSKAGFVSGQEQPAQLSLLLNSAGRESLDPESPDQPGRPP